MKKYLIILFALFSIGCGTKKIEEITNIENVHDGDTFTTNGKSIRLLGSDTPEIQVDGQTDTKGFERLYAVEARNFTQRVLSTNKAFLEIVKNDKYNRSVGIVHIGDTTLSLMLVKAGLARVAYISNMHTNNKYKGSNDYYYSDSDYIKRLYKAQEDAALNKRGFWKDPNSFNIIFPKA